MFFPQNNALIASLEPREGKEAIISGQEDKQGIKFKEGAIKCCTEKITFPPNEWRNIPFSKFDLGSTIL